MLPTSTGVPKSRARLKQLSMHALTVPSHNTFILFQTAAAVCLFVSFLGKNAHKLFDTESESCSLSGEQCLHWRRGPWFCGPWPGAGPEQPGIRVQPLFCLRAWPAWSQGKEAGASLPLGRE